MGCGTGVKGVCGMRTRDLGCNLWDSIVVDLDLLFGFLCLNQNCPNKSTGPMPYSIPGVCLLLLSVDLTFVMYELSHLIIFDFSMMAILV